MHKVKQNLPFLQTRILHPHGATPCTAKVKIKVLKNRWIFKIKAPQKWLAIPSQKTRERADFLWQSTCLECFIFDSDSENYVEYNFSPNGAWALYSFDSYRKNAENPQSPPPQIIFKKTRHFQNARRGAWEFFEIHAIPKFSPPFENARLHFCAVLKNKNGEFFYFAERHFKESPDFHYFPR